MKTYREFLDYVEDNIISCLPAEYAGGTVKIFKVAKDNDITFIVLNAEKKEYQLLEIRDSTRNQDI